MASLIGKSLGNYIVEGELGSGGMDVVLLARQESLDRPAVLKESRPELREDAELAERFRREARTAAAIHHPNVVAVYDRFAWRGNEYIAQEFVDGADLSSVLKCCGPLPPRIASMIVLEVVRGLEEIHTQGTVHRDLKPQNIIVGRKGEVKIADFGLALDAHSPGLTQPGVMLGSPPYMPPEQMLGERVDARCDLFSLGVVLYELLTNRLPYPEPGSDESESLLNKMRKERYPALRKHVRGVPRHLKKIVRGCLKAKARRRISSAALIRRQLERELGRQSPIEMRQQLAGWLWEHQVFECRENETVVRTVEPVSLPETSIWRRSAIAALLAAAICLGLLATQPASELLVAFDATQMMDRVSDSFESGSFEIAAEQPPDSSR
ncbi:MAG: serine/threonine protein kinase [Deltaproteobacteria bacterium]|nr:serine/threonine protein kinase [Deltaproteobacteria bacterium]